MKAMIEYFSRKLDKQAWGDGPWVDEPDKAQWEDEKTGMPCLAVRNSTMGHWCGYVGVSKAHPYFDKPYNNADVSVHGGLTYSEKCVGDVCHTVEEGEDDDIWWLGFDCAHAGDYSPGMEARLKKLGRAATTGLFGGAYKTLDYVKSECADLAKQLKAATPKLLTHE